MLSKLLCLENLFPVVCSAYHSVLLPIVFSFDLLTKLLQLAFLSQHHGTGPAGVTGKGCDYLIGLCEIGGEDKRQQRGTISTMHDGEGTFQAPGPACGLGFGACCLFINK